MDDCNDENGDEDPLVVQSLDNKHLMSEFYNLKMTLRSSSIVPSGNQERQLNYGIIRTTVAKDLFNANVQRKRALYSTTKVPKNK